MKKIVCVMLFSLVSMSSASAQWPVLTPDVLDTIHERKAEMFRYMKRQAAISMQTVNQEQYDVRYYNIDLSVDPDLRRLAGTVQMRAEVVGDPIDHIEVDLLNNMTVSQITLSGTPTSFTHQHDLLDIDLERSYATGESVGIVIDYEGNPATSGLGSFGFDLHAGRPMIWSLSEPFGARNWWPCKDQPSDKADSVDIRVTVPEGMIVASNGVLREVTDNGDTETYWWHESYPITTYLVSVAIYEYATYSDYYKYSPTDSMEIQFYVFPDHLENLRSTYAKTKDMLAIFSDLFGPYPFLDEKYGQAEFIFGGGMEHQTCTSLGGWSEALIAHELAHQWWGDMITCRDFHHIWLNEGFATYSEALYWEQVHGKEAYFEDMNRNRYFGEGTIYVPDLTNIWRIFDGGLSYNKGSWVLHMLRHVVGDPVFFDILRAYYDSQYQHGTAVTEDFQSLCEAVSGMELGWFFQEWIYGEFYPEYDYSWTMVEQSGGYSVDLTIEQVQTNTAPFTMPVDVTFITQFGEETFVIFDSLQTQTFELILSSKPIVALLDVDGWILKMAHIPGDMTGEGVVDVQDLAIVVNAILGKTELSEEQYQAADCNNDGTLDVLDLICMATIILTVTP
ncbi:MAG: peptidase M1 [Gemmatimonadota bacterium]|nr:MAG: peptidase M1 [Gemmatimonadota bacterium]